MKTLLKLAWRNIWRNKRRTIITVSSIFFAVLLALFMRSMQLGSYSKMIIDSVESYSGYIQVHKAGYWEDKSINDLIELSDSLKNAIESVPHVKNAFPRLETTGLAASEKLNKFSMIIGINPEEEDKMTRLSEKIIEGKYLTSESNGVIISSGLSNFLKLGVNDTIVFIGQGYHGSTAVGKYPIEGIVKLANPKMDKGMVYMPLQVCQTYSGAEKLGNAFIIVLDNFKYVPEVQATLKQGLGEKYEVMNWEEIQPELVQIILADNAGGVIMLGILYIVIAFGIFGTIMMMTIERLKEFGVLVAVGMHKSRLMIIVIIEALLIGIFGILISFGAGIPLLLIMQQYTIQLTGDAADGMLKMGIEPIIPFSLDPVIFYSQGLAIFLIVGICIIYPLFKIKFLNPIYAIKSHR
ncbi:ABC transporter permease [Flexithrix dorotheae]|uniref:ABC transporter permease n=1 Tax=Flexithrix dorotheae TaxID=70993 RepID=UPI00035F7090|nr:FtsX-like permease family protein [Flexithrix dorotheae]